MGDLDHLHELSGLWSGSIVLKRDIFSTVERGHFIAQRGEIDAVLRRLDEVRWWSSSLAYLLFWNERRALAIAGPLGIAPPLLLAGRRFLVRGWIDGVPLQMAKPHGEVAFFRDAKAALRKLHRAGVTHNDLAKSQNWLYRDGRAYLIDFQLAWCFRRRGRLFRIARYEDVRHLLKHKRRYVPDAITAAERKILARKSLVARLWMASGKRLYYVLTRGLDLTDNEGRGTLAIREAPELEALLRQHPQVRDAAVVTYADRRAGMGLYAFVNGSVSERTLREFLGRRSPQFLQIVDALPRDASGKVRNEILELIAVNQPDLIRSLLKSDAERTIVDPIVRERLNLRDRFDEYIALSDDRRPRVPRALAAVLTRLLRLRRDLKASKD